MPMAKVNPQVKFTVRDYKSLPPSETKRYELLGGDLILAPSPNSKHQRVVGELFFHLKRFVHEHRLGAVLFSPLDVILGEDVVQPDILFVSPQRAHIIDDDMRGAPDLVVEVLSPATQARDRGYKRTCYARHGVREYWLVDPDARMVEVLSLGEQDFETVASYRPGRTLASPLLAGFALPLDQIF